VKLPEISALPSEITAFEVGADSTSPSSSMANWLYGCCLPVISEVICLKISRPVESNSRFTAGWLV
jgi:hypothetical protein